MDTKYIKIGAVSAATLLLGAGAFFLGTQLMQNDGTTIQSSVGDIILEQPNDVSETTGTSMETTVQTTTDTSETQPVDTTSKIPAATETTSETETADTTSKVPAARETTSETEIAATAGHDPVPETPSEPVQQPAANDPTTTVLRAYAGTLRNFMTGTSYNSNSRYDLFDITQDGIPELFISVTDQNTGDYAHGSIRIYTYSDGRINELTAAVVNDDGFMGRDEYAALLGYDGVIMARSGSGMIKGHDTSYGGGSSIGFCDSYYEHQSDGYLHWIGNLMYDSMSGYVAASGTAGAAIDESEYQYYKSQYEGNGNLISVGRQYYFPQSADDWAYVGDQYIG